MMAGRAGNLVIFNPPQRPPEFAQLNERTRRTVPARDHADVIEHEGSVILLARALMFRKCSAVQCSAAAPRARSGTAYLPRGR
jgi:hypothetical protein